MRKSQSWGHSLNPATFENPVPLTRKTPDSKSLLLNFCPSLGKSLLVTVLTFVYPTEYVHTTFFFLPFFLRGFELADRVRSMQKSSLYAVIIWNTNKMDTWATTGHLVLGLLDCMVTHLVCMLLWEIRRLFARERDNKIITPTNSNSVHTNKHAQTYRPIK